MSSAPACKPHWRSWTGRSRPIPNCSSASGFSPDRGLLPGNDLTGDVVLLQLDKESDGSFTLTPASPKAARTATYRVAADVVCTVYCGTEELTRATLPLFEVGRDVELALPSKK